MKKILLILFAGFSAHTTVAQDINDALRYSSDQVNGTARFRAMGGAFGALGGDFSATGINAAGSVIFGSSTVGLTLSSYNRRNKADYFGSEITETNGTFDLNQAGAVFAFNNRRENSKWKRFAISINYDSGSSFDNSIVSYGVNPTTSAADYFLSYANEVRIPENDFIDYTYDSFTLREQQAYIGYHSYIINAAAPGSDLYISNVPVGGNYVQENYQETTGFNGKLSLNLAASYRDRLYFGVNLNTSFIDYHKSTTLFEDNSNAINQDRPTVSSLRFDNDLYTYGNGFSAQLGIIAKLTHGLRAGISYETPTWYELNDELRSVASSYGVNYLNDTDDGISDSDFTIPYEPYYLRTPGKWTGSLAYIFGKSGLLSVDYSVKDYRNIRFHDDYGSYFSPINQQIENAFDIAGEWRAGGEYRIKNWSLRGGFTHTDSPYKDLSMMSDRNGFSAGFGYRFPRTQIDLAYSRDHQRTNEGLLSRGLTSGLHLETDRDNFAMTVLFNL